MAEVIEKSGLTGARTESVPYMLTVMSEECETTPFVAVTRSAKVPVEGELSAVSVRIEDVLPPAGTVTGVGRLTVIPSGATPVQAADRLIVELKPFTDEYTRVVDFDTSGVKVMTAGEGWLRKSGRGVEKTVPAVPAGVTVSQRAAL